MYPIGSFETVTNHPCPAVEDACGRSVWSGAVWSEDSAGYTDSSELTVVCLLWVWYSDSLLTSVVVDGIGFVVCIRVMLCNSLCDLGDSVVCT